MVTYTDLLRRKDFFLFLTTQFLGAFNDNFYKMVVSLLVVHGAVTGEPLSITAIVFLVPSLLFSGYAGFFADRYSKRNVLIITKACEIIAMVFAFFAIGAGSTLFMLAVLFAMATQSVFFSPAKYGILPEIVSIAELSLANGLLQMSTYIAILLGGVFGGLLLNIWGDTLYKISLSLIVISIIGTACSFGIAHVKATSQRPPSFNPWGEITQGCKQYFKQSLLFGVSMAIAYFWALGLAMQVNLVALGYFTLNWSPLAIACMQAALGIGIGAGSLLAGKMSGDKIEPGLIPLGALLMSIALLSLASTQLSENMTYLLLIFLGLSAGLYIVPLNALLQKLPEEGLKGRMIATTNFLGATAMLLAALATWFFYSQLALSPKTVFTIFGAATLFLFVMAVKVFPDFFLRFLTYLITHTIYRVRTIGFENVPVNGPALLVCNHVSYVDGMILSGAIPRFIRYLVLKDFYDHKLLHWLFRLAHAIPIKEGEYETTLVAFEEVRESLRQGHVVCIFAEGAITRTGQLLPFRKGFERIMQDLPQVPIIPVYIDELWNSIFAYRDGRVIWKLPKHLPIRVTLSFGTPLPGNSKAVQVRQAVQELGAVVKFHTKKPNDTLSKRILRMARWRYFKFCMVDANKKRISYGVMIGNALVLSRLIRWQYPDETFIGVLLPLGVDAALVNVAITLAGKTAINFDGIDAEISRQYFIKESHIKVVITPVEFDALQKNNYPIAAFIARVATLTLPKRWVLKFYGDAKVNTDTTAVVCFSRGIKTSMQGALLSHCNIIANVLSHSYVLHLKGRDRMMAVLPFSDAYGYTCNLWISLLNGMGLVFYPHPAQNCEAVGRMMSQYKTSIMFDRIENYNAYLADIRPSRFSYIRCAVVAGESLPDAFASEFAEKFALELLDSYGCVEMGPGIAINVPDVRRPGRMQRGSKAGSAGHPLPGVAVKVVDLATGKTLENGEEGLLLVRGLGIMQGYLGEPAMTHAAFRDDWYITGDLVILDSDGFLFYKGRA